MSVLAQICTDVFGLLVLVFNGLLIYSLSANRGSVSSSLWALLIVREVFGVIFCLALYAQKWAAAHQNSSSSRHHYYNHNNTAEDDEQHDDEPEATKGSVFCIFFIYFVLLFGFALAELVIMTSCGTTITSASSPLSPVVFAWFFLVVDWLVVFIIFVMGIFLYDDITPSFSMLTPLASALYNPLPASGNEEEQRH